MQVIAPDSHASFGGKSSPREEARPGDRPFDALLRDEEARRVRDPLPPREPRETRRPADDDTRAEKVTDDRSSAAADRPDTRYEQEKPVAGRKPGEEAAGEARPRNPKTADSRPEDATAGVAGQAEVPQGAAAAPASAATKGSSGAATAVPAFAAMTTATGAAASTQTASTSAAANPTPAAAAAPAGGAAAETQAGTAQPAGNTAEDAGPDTTTQRPAPGTPPAEGAARPSAHGTQTAGQPGVTMSQTATLEARPAAALGGGAAAAVLAQAGEAETPAAVTTTVAPDTSARGQPAAAVKPTGQANQAAKAAEPVAGSDAAGSRGTAAGATTEPGAPQPGQPLATPAAAGGSAPVHHGSFSEALAQARHGTTAGPAEQIAIQVQRAQVAGQDQISIKLHPAELGRIEVKLETGGDGTLRAVISAERSETLDLLQRDARSLERALQEAGVKTDSGSLSFNLRGQGQNHEQQAGSENGSGRSAGDGRPGGGEALPAEARAYRSSHSGTLDIRV